MRPLKKEDYLGKKYARLTVIDVIIRNRESIFVCKCDCGNSVESSSFNVKNGHTLSCGCAKIKHGCNKVSERKPIYKIWDAMVQRCTNPNNKVYRNYGGRGINVCERWLSFANFFVDVGEKPDGLELDRINVNGNYEPGNVRWISHKDNNRNKRDNVFHSFNGKSQTLQAWSEETGIPYGCLRSRIARGWPLERVFTEAPNPSTFNGRNKTRGFFSSNLNNQ